MWAARVRRGVGLGGPAGLAGGGLGFGRVGGGGADLVLAEGGFFGLPGDAELGDVGGEVEEGLGAGFGLEGEEGGAEVGVEGEEAGCRWRSG